MSYSENRKHYDDFVQLGIPPSCFVDEIFPPGMTRDRAGFWLPEVFEDSMAKVLRSSNEILLTGGFRAEAMVSHLCSEIWRGVGGKGTQPRIPMADAWGALFMCELLSEARCSNIASWTVEHGRLKPSLRLRPWKDPGLVDDSPCKNERDLKHAEETARKRFLWGIDSINAVHLVVKSFQDIFDGKRPFSDHSDVFSGKTMRDMLALFKGRESEARRVLPAWYLNSVFSGIDDETLFGFVESAGEPSPENLFRTVVKFCSHMSEELAISSRNAMNDATLRNAFLGGSPDEALLLRSSDPGFHCDELLTPVTEDAETGLRKPIYSDDTTGSMREKIGWRTSRLLFDLVLRLDAIAVRRGLPRQYAAPSAMSLLRYDRIAALAPMVDTRKNRHDPRIPHTNYYEEMKRSMTADFKRAQETGIPFEWMRGLSIPLDAGEEEVEKRLLALWRGSEIQPFPLIADAKYDYSEGEHGMFAPFMGNFVRRQIDGAPDERDILCAMNAVEKLDPRREKRKTRVVEIPASGNEAPLRVPLPAEDEPTR